MDIWESRTDDYFSLYERWVETSEGDSNEKDNSTMAATK
jgi:hypothetical protein